jgi:hypothetical protein
VVAKVTATNSFGTSEESEVNTSGALIETLPHAHANAPTRGALTHETQIEIDFQALVGAETGGSPILSYVVLWDDGLGGSLVARLGDVTANLDTSVTFTTGISSGVEYRFAIYARNAHGDGPESASVTVLAATVPSPMNPPEVSAVSAHSSLQYRVTVTAPHSGGAGVAIDAYRVLFKYSDGSGYAELAECGSPAADVVTNLYCDVSLSSLTASPFNL